MMIVLKKLISMLVVNFVLHTVVRHFMNINHRIPRVLDKFVKKEINHIAFVGHKNLMHSRKLL